MITVDDSIRIIRDAFEIKWRKNLDFAHIIPAHYRKRTFRLCGSFIRIILISIKK
mgnify:CR=1 FL=1